jgi:hypothetical protein
MTSHREGAKGWAVGVISYSDCPDLLAGTRLRVKGLLRPGGLLRTIDGGAVGIEEPLRRHLSTTWNKMGRCLMIRLHSQAALQSEYGAEIRALQQGSPSCC